MDGTDLSIAYGGGSAYDTMALPLQAQSQGAVAPPPAVAPGAQSHAQAPEVPYNPPAAMYAAAGPVAPVYSVSFWDRLASKKWDVVKTVVLSLIVLLAIATDGVAMHYLSKYMSESILTSMQEFLVRISYPVVVILAIWVIKASM